MVKVGINGFGRIGRLVARRLLAMDNVELVQINDLASVENLAFLFKYDSVHGRLGASVAHENTPEGDFLVVSAAGRTQRILVTKQPDPANLGWGSRGVQIVVESTGRFVDRANASKHLQAGAKKVIISAPAKEKDIPTIVLGVNEGILTPEMAIVSNASCTTNCLAPLVKVLDDKYGVTNGYMTTVHAYTADQALQDAPHKDARRGRGATLNIVPTSTGAAKAVGLVLPHLNGKLDGIALRVPVANGSMIDLTVEVSSPADSADELRQALRDAAQTDRYAGIIEYATDPLVSSDIVGNAHSSIVDAELAEVRNGGRMLKVFAWYDNEWGYSNRVAELVAVLHDLGYAN